LTLVAVCEGTSVGDQIFGVLLALIAMVAWLGIAWRVVWYERKPDQRGWLCAVLVVAAAVGAIILTSLHMDAEDMVIWSLLAVVPIGAGAALLSRRFSVFAGVAAAIAGDAVLPLGIIVVLLLYVSLGVAAWAKNWADPVPPPSYHR
jgi:hypothetical protein